ncbi:MAG: hypothetical protein EU548_03375 [Promethearchaeota archaeon]|nr:MAG: hypothetical protein EU548_03375 [Candidatus Lokiarchaeota archaeon]
MVNDKLQLYAPEFLFKEFKKFEDSIIEKTRQTNEDFQKYLNLLKELILIIPKKDIVPFIDKAKEISPDPNDIIYFALALAFNASMWSNNKELKYSQDKIKVYSTQDLIRKIHFLKK